MLIEADNQGEFKTREINVDISRHYRWEASIEAEMLVPNALHIDGEEWTLDDELRLHIDPCGFKTRKETRKATFYGRYHMQYERIMDAVFALKDELAEKGMESYIVSTVVVLNGY